VSSFTIWKQYNTVATKSNTLLLLSKQVGTQCIYIDWYSLRRRKKAGGVKCSKCTHARTRSTLYKSSQFFIPLPRTTLLYSFVYILYCWEYICDFQLFGWPIVCFRACMVLQGMLCVCMDARARIACGLSSETMHACGLRSHYLTNRAELIIPVSIIFDLLII
jgi:hypothetical protein